MDDICDSHFHVFGPPDRFPLVPTSKYVPPVSSVADHARIFKPLGVRRLVFIQPSCYGTDNRCMLEAMRPLGPRARAVVAIAPDIPDAELQVLHDAGARGIRLNAVNGSTVASGQLREVARKLKPLGWHLQVHIPMGQLPELADALLGTELPIVVDHFGTPDPAQGVEQPTYRTLARMLETGRCWVKLSAPFRVSKAAWPYADMIPFAQLLLRLRPDRMVWGSDWPYIHFIDKVPADYDPLQFLQALVTDRALLQAVLCDNARRLYDFGAAA